MDQFLLPRVLAAAVVDGSLAILCGLLLAVTWLRRFETGSLPVVQPAALRWPAILLFLALLTQLWLLAATMVSSTSVHTVLAAMPDVLSMHAGRRAEYTIGVAFLLMLCAIIPLKAAAKLWGCALLLFACILLRSATGHAAVDGDFSLAEALQAAHLSSMALWSGGVMISGLLIVPRLVRASNLEVRHYVSSLSTVSTWAVATVALSGVIKGYRAVDGHLKLLGASLWGVLLLVKIVCVSVAVLLGGLNRLRLMPGTPWTDADARRSMRILRAEGYVMAAVVVLSAWLANMPPPGE